MLKGIQKDNEATELPYFASSLLIQKY